MVIDHRITDDVVYSALLAYLAVALLYEAGRSQDRTRLGKPITQRRRYGYLLLAQSLFTGCEFWLLWVASVHDLRAAFRGWLVFGPLGWLVDLGLLLIAVSPLGWVYTRNRIYSRPVPLAYKRFGCNEYCTTVSYRNRKREFVGPVPPISEDELEGALFQDAAPSDFGIPPL